jgi:hypothetical protein
VARSQRLRVVALQSISLLAIVWPNRTLPDILLELDFDKEMKMNLDLTIINIKL